MNTIIGKSYVGIRDEKEAGGGITPGMLVQRESDDTVVVHAVAGGSVAPLFALEDENQGNDIADAYVSGDVVKLWRPVPGEQVYAFLDNSGTAVVIGDFLESAGNGKLRKQEGPQSSAGNEEFPKSIVAVALEAASPGASVRVLVEIV
jgi:hypothetical protein